MVEVKHCETRLEGARRGLFFPLGSLTPKRYYNPLPGLKTPPNPSKNERNLN